MSELQSAILRDAYATSWNDKDETFKNIVFELYRKSFMVSDLIKKEYEDIAYKIAEREDWQLVSDTLELAKESIDRSINTMDLKDPKTEDQLKFTVLHNDKEITLHCHEISPIYIDGNPENFYVHYLPEAATGDIAKIITKKRRILATHDSKRHHVFIRNKDDLSRWQEFGPALFSLRKSFAAEPLHFDYMLPGNLSPSLLVDTFFAEGSFIENLGLEVDDVCAEILEKREATMDHQTFLFTKALRLFWPHFCRFLKSQDGLIRYHDIFGFPSFEGLSSSTLRMKNVLIDEFQDINGEIAKWSQSHC